MLQVDTPGKKRQSRFRQFDKRAQRAQGNHICISNLFRICICTVADKKNVAFALKFWDVLKFPFQIFLHIILESMRTYFYPVIEAIIGSCCLSYILLVSFIDIIHTYNVISESKLHVQSRRYKTFLFSFSAIAQFIFNTLQKVV